jgi:hypothetical protein
VEEIPGLEGTDLELAHNLQGDNLVLRVNKGGKHQQDAA